MNANDARDGASRVEREVLEILERADAAQSPVENVQDAIRRKRTLAQAQLSKSSSKSLPFPKLNRELACLLIALGLAALAAVLSDVSRFLGVLLAIAAAIAFFSLWVPFGTPGPGHGPRWRGQDLQGPSPPPLDFDRFRQGKKPPQ